MCITKFVMHAKSVDGSESNVCCVCCSTGKLSRASSNRLVVQNERWCCLWSDLASLQIALHVSDSAFEGRAWMMSSATGDEVVVGGYTVPYIARRSSFGSARKADSGMVLVLVLSRHALEDSQSNRTPTAGGLFPRQRLHLQGVRAREYCNKVRRSVQHEERANAHHQTRAEARLLMVGSSSTTFEVGNVVVKITRIDDEADITTQDNAKATAVETNVYQILGHHPRIVRCLYTSPFQDMVILEYYGNGDLRTHVARHGPTRLQT
jgi:hypothetical protein